MGNIERKEINQLEFIKQKVINSLTKEGKIFLYKKIIVDKIKSANIFYVKSQTGNISLFIDEKGEYLFGTADIIKDLGTKKYNSYLQKLGYKEIKDKNGYYHMINIKTKKEIAQENIKYYEVFEILNNITDRKQMNRLLFLEGKIKKVLDNESYDYLTKKKQKEYGPIVEKMVTTFYTLRPIDLILLEKHNIISKEQYNQLKGKVYSFEYIEKLIENPVWEYVEGKITTKKIQGKIYKLNTNQITEDELKLYLDLNIINKQEYELLKDILEKRKLRQEKKEHIEKTRKHISSLENDVIDNLG